MWVGMRFVRVALDTLNEQTSNKFSCIKVLTQHPETLDESNWNCGCIEPHVFDESEKNKLHVFKVKEWSVEGLSPHFNKDEIVGVVSCLGNRQLFHGDRVGAVGTQALVQSLVRMDSPSPPRLVTISCVGILDDWPPVDWFWGGTVLKYLFLSLCGRECQDLTLVEETITKNSQDESKQKLDYLLVAKM